MERWLSGRNRNCFLFIPKEDDPKPPRPKAKIPACYKQAQYILERWLSGRNRNCFLFIPKEDDPKPPRPKAKIPACYKQAQYILERWLSGRRRSLGKRVRVHALHGFESHPLRNDLQKQLYAV